MADNDDYWSHISIEDLGGMPRMLNTAYGPVHFPGNPERSFLVLLIDTEGDEWLTEFAPDYQQALAVAEKEAEAFGGIEIVDKVRGGHC